MKTGLLVCRKQYHSEWQKIHSACHKAGIFKIEITKTFKELRVTNCVHPFCLQKVVLSSPPEKEGLQKTDESLRPPVQLCIIKSCLLHVKFNEWRKISWTEKFHRQKTWKKTADWTTITIFCYLLKLSRVNSRLRDIIIKWKKNN